MAVSVFVIYQHWIKIALPWRHDVCDGFSNHQHLDCLFMRRSKKTSKLRVTGLCVGNSPVTGEFPAQRDSTISFDDVIMAHGDAVGGNGSAAMAMATSLPPGFNGTAAGKHAGRSARHTSSFFLNWEVTFNRHNSNFLPAWHDVIMSTIGSQITSPAIVYLSVYSAADQRKHDRWIPRTKGQ